MRQWLAIALLFANACERHDAPAPKTSTEPSAKPKTPSAEETAAADALAKDLVQRALEALQRNDAVMARNNAAQALAINPGYEGAQAVLHSATEVEKQIVAGRWRLVVNTDPMDDSSTVATFVVANGSDRNLLYARCRDRKLDLFVALKRSWIGRGRARVRIDEHPANEIAVHSSPGNDTMFFADKHATMKALASAQSMRLLVEVPTYDGREVIEFPTAGAPTALPKVIDACGGFPKPKRECNLPWPARCAWEVE